MTFSGLLNDHGLTFGMVWDRVSLDQAACCRLVQRWATSAELDHEALEGMWGEGDTADGKKAADSFKVCYDFFYCLFLLLKFGVYPFTCIYR